MQGKASPEGSTAAAAEGSQLYSQLLRRAEQQGADAARRWEELKQVRLTKGEKGGLSCAKPEGELEFMGFIRACYEA